MLCDGYQEIEIRNNNKIQATKFLGLCAHVFHSLCSAHHIHLLSSSNSCVLCAVCTWQTSYSRRKQFSLPVLAQSY
jgi:ferredoxin-like protein FixX